MMILVTLVAGLLLGASAAAWWLNRRMTARIQAAEQAVAETTRKNTELADENRTLKQQAADLNWQLNDSRKTVRYLESRYQSGNNNNN